MLCCCVLCYVVIYSMPCGVSYAAAIVDNTKVLCAVAAGIVRSMQTNRVRKDAKKKKGRAD